MRRAPVASWWSPAERANTRSSTSTMLDWTSWVRFSNSGSAAGRLSLKTRSGLQPRNASLVLQRNKGIFYSDFRSFFKVSVEKSCMQFSIQRPTLPSAETHPEEKLYRRLDVTTWLRHLNHSGQVEEEYKLRKVCLCSCSHFFSLQVHTSLSCFCPYSQTFFFIFSLWITQTQSHFETHPQRVQLSVLISTPVSK